MTTLKILATAILVRPINQEVKQGIIMDNTTGNLKKLPDRKLDKLINFYRGLNQNNKQVKAKLEELKNERESRGTTE